MGKTKHVKLTLPWRDHNRGDTVELETAEANTLVRGGRANQVPAPAPKPTNKEGK